MMCQFRDANVVYHLPTELCAIRTGRTAAQQVGTVKRSMRAVRENSFGHSPCSIRGASGGWAADSARGTLHSLLTQHSTQGGTTMPRVIKNQGLTIVMLA